MPSGRIGYWLGASLFAAALIGCGGEDGAPPPKKGEVPPPPSEAAKAFQKPANMPKPKTKSGSLHSSPNPLRDRPASSYS